MHIFRLYRYADAMRNYLRHSQLSNVPQYGISADQGRRTNQTTNENESSSCCFVHADLICDVVQVERLPLQPLVIVTVLRLGGSPSKGEGKSRGYMLKWEKIGNKQGRGTLST